MRKIEITCYEDFVERFIENPCRPRYWRVDFGDRETVKIMFYETVNTQYVNADSFAYFDSSPKPSRITLQKAVDWYLECSSKYGKKATFTELL